MILDTLDRAALYHPLHPLLAAGFAFLRRPDLGALADGRHAIDGERVYAILQAYETRPWAEGSLEIHRRYMDIQCLLVGEERIGFAPLADQAVKTPYDEAKDIAFLEGTGDPIRLRPGLFAVFFPHDAHMPGRTMDRREKVRKVVVKVAAER